MPKGIRGRAICAVAGCDRPVKGRGYCAKHYQRLNDHGSTSDPRPSFEDRFWSRVSRRQDGCWLWTGAVGKHGYGVISRSNRMVTAHRTSFEMQSGERIPPGLLVCHHCDNRRCVRPDHLFLGTYADNSRDMKAKGRSPHGENAPNRRLTEADVLAIRDRLNAGATRAQIAAEYEMSVNAIRSVALNLTWAHVAAGKPYVPAS